jgi:hypothetical protein
MDRCHILYTTHETWTPRTLLCQEHYKYERHFPEDDRWHNKTAYHLSDANEVLLPALFTVTGYQAPGHRMKSWFNRGLEGTSKAH